jgi:hypothetical protein
MENSFVLPISQSQTSTSETKRFLSISTCSKLQSLLVIDMEVLPALNSISIKKYHKSDFLLPSPSTILKPLTTGNQKILIANEGRLFILEKQGDEVVKTGSVKGVELKEKENGKGICDLSDERIVLLTNEEILSLDLRNRKKLSARMPKVSNVDFEVEEVFALNDRWILGLSSRGGGRFNLWDSTNLELLGSLSFPSETDDSSKIHLVRHFSVNTPDGNKNHVLLKIHENGKVEIWELTVAAISGRASVVADDIAVDQLLQKTGEIDITSNDDGKHRVELVEYENGRMAIGRNSLKLGYLFS